MIAVLQHINGWHLAALGSLFAVALAIRQLTLAKSSKLWPEAGGRIVESRIVRSRGGKGQTVWQPVVRYDYMVAGTPYSGSRIAYHLHGGTTAGASATTVNNYLIGSAVRVRYDPASPGRSVLEVGSGPNNWLFLWISIGMASGFIWAASTH